MRRCSFVWLAFCFLLVSNTTSGAVGIEAAADAEKLIESCRNDDIVLPPLCIGAKLNREWKKELEYAGKRFSAIGYFDGVKRSLVGNHFAFVTVDEYRVGCKITETDASRFSRLGVAKKVLISGVLESYRLSFNLHHFRHLRLASYCLIEVVT